MGHQSVALKQKRPLDIPQLRQVFSGISRKPQCKTSTTAATRPPPHKIGSGDAFIEGRGWWAGLVCRVMAFHWLSPGRKEGESFFLPVWAQLSHRLPLLVSQLYLIFTQWIPRISFIHGELVAIRVVFTFWLQ